MAASGENPKKLLPPSSSYPDSSRVAAYVSPPYSEYAKLILKVSHNLGANLGLCLLAVHAKSADGNAGFALLKDFLTAAKVDVAQLAMSDGEGGPGRSRHAADVRPDSSVLDETERFQRVSRVFTNPRDRRLAEQRRRGFAGSRQSVRQDRDQCGL